MAGSLPTTCISARSDTGGSTTEPAQLYASPKEEKEDRKAVEQAVQISTTRDTAPRATGSSSTFDAGLGEQGDAEEEIIDIEPVAVGLCFSIILFSLFMLSLSPHQEPRFLLALAFPSTIIMAYALQSPYFTLRPKFTRALLAVHVIQHFLQLILFSFLHQGALLPTLFSIDRSLSNQHLPSNTI